MVRSLKNLPNHWAGINLQGLLLGIIIGSVINIFTFIFSEFKLRFPHVMATYMFSIVISLSISNIICFAQYVLSKNIKGKWFPILIYYGGCVSGMIIGTELSYILLWQIWGAPYKFLGHPDQIAFNLTIAVMVCSILFIYETKKSKYALKISQQELEVIKLKQLKTQADLQTLQSKINPHFLYNALNSIALLIHEDADKAEDMTLKLSKLFRYSINSQEENFATVQEEIEVVNTYFDIEKIRFGDRIKIAIQVSIARSRASRVREWIGDRHERDRTADDTQSLPPDIVEHAANRTRPTGLVAVDGTGDDDPWAGIESGKIDGFKMTIH